MNRPYPTYPKYSTTPRHDDPGYGYGQGRDDYRGDYAGRDDHSGRDDYEDYPDDFEDDFGDDVYTYVEPIDRRWIWVAGVAGAVLLVAVICTIVILGGGDSGSVSATVAPPATTSAPAASSSAPPSARPTTSAPPVATLPRETVTTVSPTPSAEATTPPPAPPVGAPVASPRTVTYQVTGTRPLLDLVTIIYTDSQGALQTDVNVALPWTKQVVLDPGVELKSVTATSVTGQLNCSITDAAGAVIVAQNTNTMITTCTQ